jgi:hypothetical protein
MRLRQPLRMVQSQVWALLPLPLALNVSLNHTDHLYAHGGLIVVY